MRRQIKAIIITIVLFSFGFVVGTMISRSTAMTNFPDNPALGSLPRSQTVLPQGNISTDDLSRAEIYQRVSPSVVSITVTRSSGTTVTEDSLSGGSGFVIDFQGHIVSNAHVVANATEIIVYFLDGTITRAELVGADFDSDLAVIKVNLSTDRLSPITFGNMDNLFVGQSVLALGSPFGQDWTLTAGIISALNRTIRGLSNYNIGSVIQTDAPINPGNSGGPLFNMQGQVIGVNSQIVSQVRANSGVGFSVPADLVQRVATELIQTGSVDYSYLGIYGGDVNLTVIEQLNLPNNQRGVVVDSTENRSPARNAGIRNMTVVGQGVNARVASADIIVAINGLPMPNFAEMIAYLAKNTRPGDTITLTVLRDSQLVDLPLTLGSRAR
ncbi:MAG: trypsin-like peptidase domain-containing protein [Phototrophicales bacterium]|nr:trypsin-like peptidase domain-containing protein [Phototrophicales bacterium]